MASGANVGAGSGASSATIGAGFIAGTLCSESMTHLRKLSGHETPTSALRGQHDFAARLRRFWKENRCSLRGPRCGVTKPAATNPETTVRESPSISWTRLREKPAPVGKAMPNFLARPRAATGAGAATGSATFGARLTGLRTFASPMGATLLALASAGVLVLVVAAAAFALRPPRLAYDYGRLRSRTTAILRWTALPLAAGKVANREEAN